MGNGFDIYHGLPTKYIDFVKDPMVKSQNNMFIKYFQKVVNENQTWIDCEQEIKRVVKVVFEVLDKIMLEPTSQSPSYLGTISVKEISDDQRNVLKNIDLIFEEKVLTFAVIKVKKDYMHPFYGINVSKIMEKIKHELDSLIQIFEEYLVNNIDLHSVTTSSEQIRKIKPYYVINFNYTSSYELYDIKEEDVCHIHGKTGNIPNNMVFGFEDEDEFDLKDIYFKKYFQRIQKRTDLLDEEKFKRDLYSSDGFDKVSTHFFGLSMGVTDGDMIKKIEQLSDECIIYYYNQEDYEAKIINLIKIFGKKCFIQKMHDREIQLEKIK